MSINRSHGTAKISRVDVDKKLQPKGNIKAILQVMPSWDDNWNVRVSVTMENQKNSVLIRFLDMPAIADMPNHGSLSGVAQYLANILTLTVKPSLDISKSAVFKLTCPNYTGQMSCPLIDLHLWFDYEG